MGGGAVESGHPSPKLGREMHRLTLADAVAGDNAFDDAIAEAIERGIGHSSRQPFAPVDGTVWPAHEGARPVIAFDDAFRELLADYADLQAEHQRLNTSPHDHASHEAHSLRLDEHFRRVQVALEQLRQKFDLRPSRFAALGDRGFG